MVDVAVSAQLQQWSFDKPALVRPERSSSSASSPDLSHREPETLRIDAAVHSSTDLDSKDTRPFQERYLSSEEDLSPMDANSSDSDGYDSEASIHDFEKECLRARKMSISRWEKGRSCDMAVTVSIVSAGRPKMIHLANAGSPIRETAQRSASLAQLPIGAINKLRKQDQETRRSMMLLSSSTSRSPSPAIGLEPRRPSTGHRPFTHSNKSALQLSDSASSFHTASSTRSISPAASENLTTSTRPVSAAPASRSQPQPRSSLYVVSNARNDSPLSPFPPLTPQSPGPHSFLSSDPYENSNTNAASPIIKSGPHKRLRSISMKLSLAKIAITPSTKKWDSRINGRGGNMPPTPATPYTPVTPLTAPATSGSSPMNKLRRNSRIASRSSTQRGPSPEIPPVPTISNPPPRWRSPQKKLVARGANEREPMIELPPFPDGDAGPMNNSIKARRVRKRKSLMDLL
ncbi:hypothetical protein BU26DRAFT_60044 [Trematosphaeria pertusa]|uniref:Uncharacterized protein n=1 Tax=Trematosphaeria pertusa TaxID=390896 RepID=A0A6A6I6P4_9PLEO|nr:uncharacterized protein BU26DRAFT_60044 [Trematosphaeria pertusa]KAF2246007.1 hypothetical protein BU26DRAFT_60044 [Trematosphaeria pertusa]